DNLATDWHIVNAAAGEVRRRKGAEAVDQQIETVRSHDVATTEFFSIGTSRRARGKTREARRFSFVRSLDALLAVAGRAGTGQELSLAVELGMPVLPVPLFGGAAAEFWHAYRTDLIQILRLDEGRLARWEAPAPDDAGSVQELARDMVRTLLDSLARRCFVIM